MNCRAGRVAGALRAIKLCLPCGSDLRLFGSTMAADVMHVALECGYIAGKLPDMKTLPIGPTLEDLPQAQ